MSGHLVRATARGRVAISTLVLALSLAGCLQSTAVECADGRACPADTTCDSVHGLCLVDGQAAACDGQAEGADCRFGAQVGICDRGVCIAAVCGNGVLEAHEACDDGNLASGDGCRADCAKIEVCGDTVVDAGEGCDDGNPNAIDGCDACRTTSWTATPIIGGAPNARTVGLYFPNRVVVDRHDNVYILDSSNYRIRRVDPSGVVTTVAGSGEANGASPDGVRATSVPLAGLVALAVDGLGNLYVTSTFRVRKIDTNGIITTIAGVGTSGFSGDGGLAVDAQISQAEGLAVDGLGNLYIADTANHRIRRVDAASGQIATIAGTGTGQFDGDGGPASGASLYLPSALAYAGGNLYIADRLNHRIRRIDAAGTITTIAGTGTQGFAGDGGPATSAQLDNPRDVTVDAAGGVWIADQINERVRHVAADGTLTTVAGTGAFGYNGDGIAATTADLRYPMGVAVDSTGVLYIADQNSDRIRRVDAAGMIATFAGSGSIGYVGEGASPLSVPLNYPQGITIDSAGRLVFTDTARYRVRRIDAAGTVRTFAGSDYGNGPDGGQALATRFGQLTDVKLDAQGNAYVVDNSFSRVRRIDTAGIVTTVAGGGTTLGDGGPGTSAQLDGPTHVAVAGGDVYIADSNHHRVRRVDATGTITTIAGTGTAGLGGDGGAATSALLRNPQGLAFDAAGNLYIADSGNSRVRRVDANGVITTFAGTTSGLSGDGGPATSAQLNSPVGVALGPNGDVYIAEEANNRVRRVATTGVITTVAGNSNIEFTGDGGPATDGQMWAVQDVAVDAAGNLYITDSYGQRIRRVDTAGVITTVVGQIDGEDMGPFTTGRLADAQALVIAPAFTLIAGGSRGVVFGARGASSWLEVVAGRYPQRLATGNLARFRDRTFGTVGGVAYDSAGKRLFVTESTASRIHVVSVVVDEDENTWTIAALTGADGFADGPVAGAKFRGPSGLYWDAAAKQLYVADPGNHVVRAIDLAAGISAATVRTIAGVPQTRGFAGDGGAASAALLYEPRALTRCPNGDLFIADTGNHRVRRIAAGTNTITTVLGDGVAGSSGEGAPASTFPVQSPLGIACDAGGNVFVTSTNTVRLLPANAAGIVDGNGEVQTIYGAPPRDTFPASVTTCLTGIAVAGPSAVQVTDACAGLLIELRLQ